IESDETFFVNLSNATGGATISTNQGLGTITNDDFAPTPTPPPTPTPAETFVDVVGGTLTITDSNGGTTDDTLTISLVSGAIRVNDPNHTLSAGPSANQVDPNTVDVSPAGVTNGILVNTLGGNDLLTL